MTALHPARRARPTVERSSRWRLLQAWAAPLWAHALALAAVLLLLVPVVGTDASFSADEGAAIIQAKSLAAGDGWVVEHPLPEIDPDARFYPIELSDKGPDGIAPFAKHPAYAAVLAAADRVGGVVGMVLLSLLGTVLAAVLAALVAGELDPSLPRPALWTVGLASPLLFDGFLVMGHALGAAFVGGAALAAVRAIRDKSGALAAAVAPCLAAAVLLRTEAALLALALVAAVALVVRRERQHVAAGLAVGASAIGAVVGARALERAWARRAAGASPVLSSPAPEDPYGFLAGRVNAFVQTWLNPSHDGFPRAQVLLLVMAAAITLAAFVARRRPQDTRFLLFAVLLAGGAAVVALALTPSNLVPGFLIAFPVGLAGLLLVHREILRSLPAQVLFGTFALFDLAVFATQYSSGGTAEWGGRYFAIGVPLLVPVALLAIRHHGDRIGGAAARRAVAGLVVCSVALATMSVASLRATHRFTADLMAAVERAAEATAVEPPVLVATSGALPRLAWATFDRQRWLLAHGDQLSELLGRLPAAGLDRVVLVSHDAERHLPRLGAGVRVDGEVPGPGGIWSIYLLTVR